MTAYTRGGKWVAVILVTIALCAVTGFAWLVWPTPYRPIALRAGSPRILAAREGRLTGRVEVLTARGGWLTLAAYRDSMRAELEGPTP